ncbi:MAG: VanZ family protein [Pseudohongiellaceae bacterium]
MNIAAFVVYTAFVTYVSLRTMDGVAIGNWDKVGHISLYFVFAIIGYRIFSNTRYYLYLCIFIIIYSGLMEVAQSFMPGRMMSVYDLLANAIGVAMAVVLTRFMWFRR